MQTYAVQLWEGVTVSSVQVVSGRGSDAECAAFPSCRYPKSGALLITTVVLPAEIGVDVV